VNYSFKYCISQFIGYVRLFIVGFFSANKAKGTIITVPCLFFFEDVAVNVLSYTCNFILEII